MKNWFLSRTLDEKIQHLRATKNSADLGNYLTLLNWLIDAPPNEGGLDIRSIPDDAMWRIK